MARLSAWWRHLGRPGRIAVIILAVFVGLIAVGLGIPFGGEKASSPSRNTPPRNIAAPIDVKHLPYYDSSWMFTKKEAGNEIDVRTDLHSDDTGRAFAVGVCNVTRSSGGKDVDVWVYDSDGHLLAHHFKEGFFSTHTCVTDH
jgi:hypothetical protein